MGGPRCAKYTLYVTNVFIIFLACVTLGVGIWMSTDVASFVSSVNPNIDPSGYGTASVRGTINNGVGRIQTVANILITSGIFALLIGFLGVWAAYKDSRTLLITYGVILMVIVLLELGAGIAWAVDKPKIIAGLTQEYTAAVSNYDYVQTQVDSRNRIIVSPNQKFQNSTAASTAFINMLQTWVGCCGWKNGYTDFFSSPYWSNSGGVAPVYCCKFSNSHSLTLEDPACGTVRTPENSWLNVGCADKIMNLIFYNTGSIIGAAVGIGMINSLGVVASFYQYYCLTQGYKEF